MKGDDVNSREMRETLKMISWDRRWKNDDYANYIDNAMLFQRWFVV